MSKYFKRLWVFLTKKRDNTSYLHHIIVAFVTCFFTILGNQFFKESDCEKALSCSIINTRRELLLQEQSKYQSKVNGSSLYPEDSIFLFRAEIENLNIRLYEINELYQQINEQK